MAARIAAVFAIFATSLCAVAPAAAQTVIPAPIVQLQAALANVPDYAPGHVALEVRDLTSGYTEGVNPNAIMPAASTIKIPVMVEVFREMEAGNFDLNRVVHLEASDRDWGSGDICDAPLGSGFTVSQLLTKMITVSDNTAANMLIRLVGRRDINAEMADLGLHHTLLADYIRTAEWSVRRTLRTTPADMVKLLTDMAKHQLIDEGSSTKMISILEGQQINTLLPAALPDDVLIAHKTGSFDDTLNDVGIVYGPEPYVIAVMTTDLPSLDAGRDFIHHISRLTFNRMEQLADWRLSNGAGAAPQTTSADSSANGATADGGNASDDVPMWGPTPAPSPSP
jgi:beta-lactamase class A